MKYKGKRLLAVLLAAVLLAWAVPMQTLAAQNGCSVMRESVYHLGGGDPLYSRARTFGVSSVPYDVGDLYSQLSVRQKACYDALAAVTVDRVVSAAKLTVKDRVYRRVVLHIPGMDGTTLDGTLKNGVFTPSASAVKVENSIYTDLCAAIVALRYDRPDMLWIDALRYGYKVSMDGSRATITGVTVDYYLAYNGQEKAMAQAMMQSAQTIADEAGKAPTTYDKVKAVYDMLAADNVYGDPKQPMSHWAYSALIIGDSYQPVCDGYSKAIKIVCDLLNIPCATPSSYDHMWNNVKMDDGEWYNMDLTWDDDGETFAHDYFLIGSQTVVDGAMFSQEEHHIENNPYDDYRRVDQGGVLQPVTLRFPYKNKVAYTPYAPGEDYPPLSFPDVRRSSWYYSAVEDVYQKGLFKGNDQGLFGPLNQLTRAEFALVMAKVFQADLTGYTDSGFTDVPAGRWYTGAVTWAKAAGLMRGDGNGLFRPNSPITRQEMCVVLKRALAEDYAVEEFRFPDDASISLWAKRAVYTCYACGLVKGDEKGLFNPRSNTQRSQAAVIFSKFSELPVRLPVTPVPDTPPAVDEPEDVPGEDTPGEDTPSEDTPGEQNPGEDGPEPDEAPAE